MALEDPLLEQEENPSQGILKHKFELWSELKQQLLIAGPMVCVNLLQFLIQITAVMFVGHLGKLSLSSASLASSSCSVSGFIIMMGMAAALETLCGQAYGAKQYRMVGIYMQRAIFVQVLICLPISVLWFYMGHVLRFVGQDPTISAHAQVYARFLIPALFGFAVGQPLIKFLQSQSIVIPMAVCAFASALLHIPLCWYLLYKLRIGGHGAAISASVSTVLNTLLLAIYIRFSNRCRETRCGFSSEALRDFRGYFKLAVPAAVMICLEAWSFELTTLMSGLLPDPQVETSAFTTIMNTLVLAYMIPFGLSAAASTRAANELGAGYPSVARAAICVTICMGIIDSAVVVTLLVSFRKVVGWAFSSDKDVVDHVGSLFKVATFIAAFDPVQGILTGIARGCGWQAAGALANLLAFYLVGLPVAITLAFFYKFNGKGLWIGIACGNATQTLALSTITIFTNWEKQAENARNRLASLNLNK